MKGLDFKYQTLEKEAETYVSSVRVQEVPRPKY